MCADRLRLPAGGVYLALAVCTSVAGGLITAAYALYYIVEARLDPLQLVLVGTTLEVSYLLFELPTGVFADAFSRRLSIIAGTGLIGLAWVGQGALPLFAAIVLFEVVRGLGEALIAGATEAWIAGEVGEDQVAALFLRETQLSRAAGLIALPLGVALATIDLAIPLVAGGAVYIAAALGLTLVMPERHHPRRGERGSWLQLASTARAGVIAARASPLIVAVLLAELFWGAASEGFDRLHEAYILAELPFPIPLPITIWFGALYFTGSVIVIVTAAVVRRRARGMSSAEIDRLLVRVQIVRIVARATFALAPTFVVALVPYFVESVVRAAFYPLYRAWLVQRTDPELRATLLSMTGVANAAGQIGGGPVSGVLGSLVSLRVAILSAGLFLVPAVAAFARATRESHRGALHEAAKDRS